MRTVRSRFFSLCQSNTEIQDKPLVLLFYFVFSFILSDRMAQFARWNTLCII
jgi:hypothetical protein